MYDVASAETLMDLETVKQSEVSQRKTPSSHTALLVLAVTTWVLSSFFLLALGFFLFFC